MYVRYEYYSCLQQLDVQISFDCHHFMGDTIASGTLTKGVLYICTIGGAVPPKSSLDRTLEGSAGVSWCVAAL